MDIDIDQLTLEAIESQFVELTLTSHKINGIGGDWKNFAERTGMSLDSLIPYALKDMILTLHDENELLKEQLTTTCMN